MPPVLSVQTFWCKELQQARYFYHSADSALRELQASFQALTEKITLSMEEMGERIDDLEKHVADLMTEAGIENTDEELRLARVAQSTPRKYIRPEHSGCFFLQQ
ncbi:PREDICTED: heat shock factor-binding protein 1-like protein 1 [Nipponia nippon]|uniref:heat shock factor-binding protein 1-like protein 1 n=1 Tax=Nipponia nippon TaxID=128390 RepID=UPI000511B21F|nr:PREDICTED: heat shock factor-binding protein 1-like protein 1 [Nipponia nippon]